MAPNFQTFAKIFAKTMSVSYNGMSRAYATLPLFERGQGVFLLPESIPPLGRKFMLVAAIGKQVSPFRFFGYIANNTYINMLCYFFIVFLFYGKKQLIVFAAA